MRLPRFRAVLTALLFVPLMLFTFSCTDTLVDSGGETTLDGVAAKKGGKGGGNGGGGSTTPLVHSVTVRAAEGADLTSWQAASGILQSEGDLPDGYVVKYFDGTDGLAQEIAGDPIAEYWGCPDGLSDCLAIDIVISGYQSADRIAATHFPVNRDPACGGTVPGYPSVTNSCAHDLGTNHPGGNTMDRRSASLFVEARGTPWVNAGDLPQDNQGRSTFTFLWQGQTSGALNADGTHTARVVLPTEHEGLSSPDYYRFKVRLEGTGGSSLDEIDCQFADGVSECVAAWTGAAASDDKLQLAWAGFTTENRSTTGKGKNRVTTVTTKYWMSAVPWDNPSLTPSGIQITGGDMVFLFQQGGDRWVTLENSYWLPDSGGCVDVTALEVTYWFGEGATSADHVLRSDQPTTKASFSPDNSTIHLGHGCGGDALPFVDPHAG